MYNFKAELVNSFLQLGKTVGAGLATIGLAGAGIRHYSSTNVLISYFKCTKVYGLLTTYQLYNLKIFCKILDRLLTLKLTKPFLLLWIRFLFLFHDIISSLYIRYGDNAINLGVLFISTFCARLHMSGWLILISLLILRIQASFRKIGRYYQADYTRLERDFPNLRMEKRYMKNASGAIVEALENPKTQAVLVGVAGALAWKAMDLWDTEKSAEIAEKDRIATMVISERDRKAEDIRRDKDRANDNAERQKDRDAEATQRQLDRESAERIASNSDNDNSLGD